MEVAGSGVSGRPSMVLVFLAVGGPRRLFLAVGGPRRFGCLRGGIHLVRAVPLLVELVTGSRRPAAVGGGLLLQTGGLSRLDVGFGLGGAGPGGGLVGQCFALLHLQRFLLGGLADLVGFDVAVLVAFVARYPCDRGDEQNCRDRDDDDQNDTGGSHVAPWDWLSRERFTPVG